MHDLTPLIDNRADPDARMVLEDAELTMGRRTTRLGLALCFIHAAAAVSDDDAAATAANSDGAHDGIDAADDAIGTDDEHEAIDAADDDDAHDDIDAADDDDTNAHAAARRGRLTSLLTKEPDMNDGLKILQVPGRYSGWAVTRIGWLRRVNGDEWELLPGARTIIRTGGPRPIDSLASQGLREDHRLTEPSGATEEIHRLLILRSVVADAAVWATHCPMPIGWRDPT